MNKNNKPGRIIKGTAKQPTLKEASGVWTLDEAMQAHRANAWPQPNLLQPIPKSVRINYTQRGTTLGSGLNNNAYLYRNPGRPGNRFTWTVSVWLKPALNANAPVILGSPAGTASGDTNTFLQFGVGQFTIQHYRIQIAVDARLRSTAYYRDSNAWYHCVFVFDSNNATASERIRGYVNGTRITSFEVYTAPQGTVTNIGSTYPQQIGRSNDATFNEAYWYDGLMSEYYYIDGYALNPSFFGTTGSDGVWISKPYTGTYGTNGFYLPFTNNSNSLALGYDASLRGQPTYDVDQDPYRGSVALHLTGNGPAGGQNNTFTDSSSNNLLISKSASPVATSYPVQGSFSPFTFDATTPYNPSIHGGSAYFSGNNVTLTASGSDLNLGSGNFTIEFWYYPTDLSFTNRNILDQRPASGNSTNLFLRTSASDGTKLGMIIAGTEYAQSTSLTINTWHHVALVRNGSSFTIYINGIAGTTSTLSPTFDSTTLLIGGFIDTQASPYGTTGYISNLRITKTAIYTSGFSLPRRPFGINTNNLIPFSEDFTAPGWNKAQTTITTNAAIAPDGTPTASKLVETTGANTHYIDKPYSFVNGTTYTYSIYVKAGERSEAIIYFYTDNGVFTGKSAWFDLTTGSAGFAGAGITTSVQNTGNGWYRLIATTTAGATATGYIGLYLATAMGSSNGTTSYQGDGTSGFYIWGAQLEAASSATTYTPTPENYSTSPSLLLKFENAAVVDSAGANNIVTANSATITSSSKYGLGALTYNLDTNDYMYAPVASTNLIMGTGDFTVEFWMNSLTGNDAYRRIISSSIGGFTGNTFCIRHQPGSFLFGPTILSSATYAFNTNTWYHIAYSRKNYTGRFFVNGQLVASVSDNLNYSEAIQYYGAYYTSGPGEFFKGSLDDIRITKGVARYQDNFTPPARALPEIGGKSFVPVNVNAGTVKTFTTVGTTSWTAPSDVNQVEVLVVAGGGAGGGGQSGTFSGIATPNTGGGSGGQGPHGPGGAGGGGGGGGVIYNSAYAVTPGQTYTVTVGDGGTSNISASGNNGGNSVFGSLVAIGGGGGSSYTAGGPKSGGSGGGGDGPSGSAGAPGAGTPGQGFAGGQAQNYNSPGYPGAGGGGAGGVGTATSSNTNGAPGGPGLSFGITGTPVMYGAGGGGGGGSGYSGGAAGGPGATAGWPSSTSTGTGAGKGGSGIVALRYTTATEVSSTTDDSIVDSPTNYGHDYQQGGEVVGNYATWNRLIGANNQSGSETTIASTIVSFNNGNLSASNAAAGGQAPRMQVHSTTGMTTGKWYAEFTNVVYRGVGISKGDYIPAGGSGSGVDTPITYYTDGTVSASVNGASGTITGTGVAVSSTDVIGIAADIDNSTVTFYVNGVSKVVITNVASSTKPADPWFFTSSPIGSGSASSVIANFGQRPWVYQPPAGFNALNTKNLPIPTITQPGQYMTAVSWTGTGAAQTITTGFKPDFIWCKTQSNDANYPIMQNTVKGITYSYGSNAADAPGNYSAVSAVTSTGFVLGTTDDSNKLNDTYIGYAFRAGGNSNIFNIDDVGYATASAAGLTGGTITPAGASVSTTAGFSIIKYNGDGNTVATIPHGLGRTPAMIWTKVQNAAGQTRVWHTGLYQGTDSDGHMLSLNATNASSYDSQRPTGGTASVFRVIGNAVPYINAAGYEYIALIWAEVPGFSKFGTYQANASADGMFVYCGFRPRWVLVKNTTRDAGNWVVLDTTLNTYNPTNYGFFPNSSARPGTGYAVDFTSNGFKIRTAGTTTMNYAVRDTYIYAAFAETPFKTARGR